MKPVDVMAAMDVTPCRWSDDGGYLVMDLPAKDRLKEARAAVEELMEAVKPFSRPGQISLELVRLQTALAGCKGKCA